MRVPSARFVLFNAAAVLVALAAIVAVVHSNLVSSSAAPCSGRYLTSMTFPLERNGVVLSATDIQARALGGDASLADSLEIVRLEGAPVPVAMRVDLPKGGMSFAWQPRSMRGQEAVCLGYQLQLPADFNFGPGGNLPGVGGQAEHGGDRFVVQPTWVQGGVLTATSRTTAADKPVSQVANGDGSAIPRGRWVRLEQEVVLNAPGQRNGLLRVWLDGRLVAERTDLAYRTAPDVGLAGVAAEVSYRAHAALPRAATGARALLSPFEIRWK
jgi:hypothetical protein